MKRATFTICALLVMAGCGETETGPAQETVAVETSAEERPAPAPALVAPEDPGVPWTLRCERHTDCRVLAGVCGNPTPSNARGVEEVERNIASLSRYASCGVRGMAVELTTPTCLERACQALHGRPAERRCDSDADCAVVEGLCGPTEVVRADSTEAFLARIQEMRARGIRCGYGERVSITAACDDGLCVPRPER